jgi:serine protein kinase
MEAKVTLRQNLDKLINEYENEILYEGKFGISPRDLKKIIYKLSAKHKSVTPVEIIDYLEAYINKRSELDYLSMTPQGDFHNAPRFLTLLTDYILTTFDREMRESLGLVDDRSYEDYLKRYIQNITALIKKEKIKNTITGKFENADEYSIKEFESNISLQEEASGFRSQLLSQLGAYALDNPRKEIVYTHVFPDLVERLQESFRNEQKKQIIAIAKNLVFFEAETGPEGQTMKTPLSQDNRKLITQTIDNLCKKYGHTQNGALSMMRYLIKERY